MPYPQLHTALLSLTPDEVVDDLLTGPERARALVRASDEVEWATTPDEALRLYAALGAPSNPAWSVYLDDSPGAAYAAACASLRIGRGTEARIWAVAWCATEVEAGEHVAALAFRMALRARGYFDGDPT